MDVFERLRRGVVIPAHPLALTKARTLDERHQRALTRYYVAAGAGGVAVGVHTTQFEIRKAGLLKRVLQLAADEARDLIRVAGICGPTRQAIAEARFAVDCGYHIGLLNVSGAKGDLVAHAREVSKVIPIMGFYLQAAVGGRELPYSFWRGLADNVERLVAIKIAAFNRYQTLDVLRAVAESGRKDVALYTGNDDAIVADLMSEYRGLRFVGGLLGQWAVGTRRAVELLDRCHRRDSSAWRLACELTEVNAALFDAANGFRGCIAGIHEVLRKDGLMAGRWCLDPSEDLSPGQAAEIARVRRLYPHLFDGEFIAAHRDRWLQQDS